MVSTQCQLSSKQGIKTPTPGFKNLSLRTPTLTAIPGLVWYKMDTDEFWGKIQRFYDTIST